MMHIFFLDKLRETNSHELPGEDAHRNVLPINRPLSTEILDLTDYRKSAVAIYLFHENDALKSLLIERPEYNGAHSKQIAFPGGKQELSDPNLEFTALREGHEEIGIHPELCIKILELTQVNIPVSKFSVMPYLFYLEQKPQLIADQREVARIIEFNVHSLLEEKRLISKTIDLGNGIRRKDIPGFQLFSDTFVWGATAMILAELKALVEKYH